MTLTNETIEHAVQAIGGLEKWAQQCHAASLQLIRTGMLPEGARVARGWATSINSQHSWVAVGNPYEPETALIDITHWSYTNASPRVLRGQNQTLTSHRPHNSLGTIFDVGPPPPPTGPIIDLDVDWSLNARQFFDMIGHPLDAAGWNKLCHSPVHGWPAAEIVAALRKDERTIALVPVDLAGMLTDENPGGLYW